MARLLKSDENHFRFGRGPNKPTRTGHCSDKESDEAIGVRVWLKFYQSPPDSGHYVKYIHDIWWTGIGSSLCLNAAACVAKRLINTEVYDDGPAHIIISEMRKEFGSLSPIDRQSTNIVLLAFVRAIFYPYYTRTDWTDDDDSNRGCSVGDDLTLFCESGLTLDRDYSGNNWDDNDYWDDKIVFDED